MNQLTRIAPRRLAVNDSYTFLMKELEKVDDTILEPLSGTDWPRDMPVITGGGLLESIASVDVSYASSGGDDDNLCFEAANDIPVIQADMSKQVARTFNFAEYMSFSTMEREKMLQVGRDPETLRVTSWPNCSTGIRIWFGRASEEQSLSFQRAEMARLISARISSAVLLSQAVSVPPGVCGAAEARVIFGLLHRPVEDTLVKPV